MTPRICAVRCLGYLRAVDASRQDVSGSGRPDGLSVSIGASCPGNVRNTGETSGRTSPCDDFRVGILRVGAFEADLITRAAVGDRPS